MAEFEINGHRYVSTPLGPYASFHVSRRLGPVINSIKDILIDPAQLASDVLAQASESSDEQERVVKLGMAVLDRSGPLLEAVAALPDDQVNYILDACLQVCKRHSGVGWQDVWNKTANQIGFDDIDMVEMLTIVRFVITENMAGFMRVLPSS